MWRKVSAVLFALYICIYFFLLQFLCQRFHNHRPQISPHIIQANLAQPRSLDTFRSLRERCSSRRFSGFVSFLCALRLRDRRFLSDRFRLRLGLRGRSSPPLRLSRDLCLARLSSFLSLRLPFSSLRSARSWEAGRFSSGRFLSGRFSLRDFSFGRSFSTILLA